jgi:hypothetical protein
VTLRFVPLAPRLAALENHLRRPLNTTAAIGVEVVIEERGYQSFVKPWLRIGAHISLPGDVKKLPLYGADSAMDGSCYSLPSDMSGSAVMGRKILLER